MSLALAGVARSIKSAVAQPRFRRRSVRMLYELKSSIQALKDRLRELRVSL